MAGSGLFIKAGFVSVESIPPYELLVKKVVTILGSISEAVQEIRA